MRFNFYYTIKNLLTVFCKYRPVTVKSDQICTLVSVRPLLNGPQYNKHSFILLEVNFKIKYRPEEMLTVKVFLKSPKSMFSP